MNKFRQITVIAGHGVRMALNTRALPVMAIIIVLLITLLPGQLKGDGSASGRLQLILRYCMALSQVVISTGIIWLSCSAMSREISTRTVHHLVSKPVSATTLWIGKWLAQVCVVLILLLISSLALGAQVLRETKRHAGNPADLQQIREEVLTARATLSPDPRSPNEDTVERVLSERRHKGSLPSGISDAVAREMVIESLIHSPVAIKTGKTADWRFQLENPLPENATLHVACRFTPASQLHRAPLHGTWTLVADNGNPPISVNSLIRTRADQEVHIPTDGLIGARTITLQYVNNESEKPVTAILKPDSLSLLVSESGFIQNYLSAMLITFTRLGLLAALGVTAGCFLSMPVSVFVSVILMSLPLMVRIIDDPVFSETGTHSHEGHGHEDHASDGVKIPETHKLAVHLLRPLNRSSTILPVSTGRLITSTEVRQSVIAHLGLYGLVMAAIGMYSIRRSQYGDARQ